MNATTRHRQLLIIACTATKRAEIRLLPALERYNGPSFRVLRRWLRDHPDAAARLDVAVLSAEFGLIPAIQPIPNYDRRMTAERALTLHGQVHTVLQQLLALHTYAGIYLSASKRYRQALNDPRSIFGTIPVQTAPEGAGIGGQLAALKQWLHTV